MNSEWLTFLHFIHFLLNVIFLQGFALAIVILATLHQHSIFKADKARHVFPLVGLLCLKGSTQVHP